MWSGVLPSCVELLFSVGIHRALTKQEARRLIFNIHIFGVAALSPEYRVACNGSSIHQRMTCDRLTNGREAERVPQGLTVYLESERLWPYHRDWLGAVADHLLTNRVH